MRTNFLAFLAAAILAGCTTAYAPVGANGGYSDARLGSNLFRVTFAGNLRSTQAETDEKALLRSAEVVLENGYPFFTSSGNASTGTALSIATGVVTVPASSVTIVGFATRPATTATVYDAEQLLATLGAKYNRR